SPSGSARSLLRFHTVTSWPPSRSRPAIGAPIRPVPRNAIRISLHLLAFVARGSLARDGDDHEVRSLRPGDRLGDVPLRAVPRGGGAVPRHSDPPAHGSRGTGEPVAAVDAETEPRAVPRHRD